jgi:hypothetical protein
MDTSEQAHQELIKLLRGLTPEKRLSMMLDRSEFGADIHREAMSRVAEQRKAWGSAKR